MAGGNRWVGMLKQSFAEFWNNGCMSMAGAIAYSRHGNPMRPEEGAVRVLETEREIREG